MGDLTVFHPDFPRPCLRQGIFFLGEEPFVPVGFNYWPSRTGVHCWKNFNIGEWEEDFREMRRRGFNTVRVFLLWPDFQPSENSISGPLLRALRQVADLAAVHGLWVMPTLFQGWMSGVNFDPEWRAGRNHVCDASLRPALVRLVRAVCVELRACANLLALDLGNEIDVVCREVTPEALRSWTEELGSAVEAVIPGLLVTNGVSTSPMEAESPWTFADQRVDFHCMHGYPMFWNPLPILSLRSARCSLLFAGMTAFAEGHGPVMRQECGAAMGGDGAAVRGFVRASSFSSFLAGANGFLHWCWRDFTQMAPPYQSNPFESSLGYVDAGMAPKEWSAGFDEFRDFLAGHAGWRPVPDPVGIYIPARFKSLGVRADAAMAAAYENLVGCGLLPRFVTKPDAAYRLLVVPMASLEADEIVALADFCEAGGRLIVLGLGSQTCGRLWEKFTGTRQTDLIRSAAPLPLGGIHGKVLGRATPPGEMMPSPVLEAVRPDVEVWLEAGGFPVGFISEAGQGRVLQCTLMLTAEETSDIQAEAVTLWKEMLFRIGYEPSWTTSSPHLQVAVIAREGVGSELLLVNHAAAPLRSTVRGRGNSYIVDLPPKGVAWTVLKNGDHAGVVWTLLPGEVPARCHDIEEAGAFSPSSRPLPHPASV